MYLLHYIYLKCHEPKMEKHRYSNYFFFLFCSLSLVLSSCSEPSPEEAEVKEVYKDELIGLASPLRLNYDETILHLQDYFPNAEGIDSLRICNRAFELDTTDFTISIKDIQCDQVDVMRIYYNGTAYDIPVFASEKVKFTFNYVPSSSSVRKVAVKGSMNGWNPSATPLEKNGKDFRTTMILDPGEYSYQIVEDGESKLDPNNPDKKSNGMGGWNSILKIGDSPDQSLCYVSSGDERSVEITAFRPLGYKAFFEEKQIAVEEQEGKYLVKVPNSWQELPESASIRVYFYTSDRRVRDLHIPIKKGKIVREAAEIARKDYRGNIMYFAMVDRFHDGDTTNNYPTPDESIHPKANHFGGDLKGITQKVNEGYFDSLGVNALWISPITQNPEGAYGLWNKGIRSTFSAYHGYWPISSTELDYRFGTAEDLKAMIQALHQDEMNVLLDYVANHVHEEHPVYQQHKDWATNLYLRDGSLNTERWDEHRLTTWFDTFLPTLDLSREEVVEPMTDSALYWVKNFELDGFRHDATKHIPELFWRRLTQKVKQEIDGNDRSLLQIGETYGNPELITSYIGSGMMDSQFDFNLYDAAVDAFAKEETDFENLKRVLRESLHAYGDHHLMGNITGNQDRARFISYADGGVKFDEDPKLAGWIRDIERMGDVGFPRLQMLTSFLMSVPGIPCIYYGDEIGMPGGNDPDNRRMMYFEGWNEREQECFANARQWIQWRRSHMPMLYGETYILNSSEASLCILRKYLDQATISVFNKNPGKTDVEVDLGMFSDLNSWNCLSGQDVSVRNGKLYIEMGDWDTALLSFD